MRSRKLRRLFWDIETSPNLVLSFRIGHDVAIGHEAIVRERAIICICWKWEGERKVHEVHWDQNQNDKKALEAFLPVAMEADELVAHYGDRFDLPWLRTRCLIHRLPPLPMFKTIDTKSWASKNFYFNSNKLDYISEVMGHGRKGKTEYSMWKEITLRNCPVSLARMIKYCRRDVAILEKAYHDLEPRVAPKTHHGVLMGHDNWTCPRCGSPRVKKTKTLTTAGGTVKHQMKCTACHGYYSINDRAHIDYASTRKPL